MFQTCFLDVWRLPEVRPVGFHPRTHQGPQFVENVGIGLARPGTVWIHLDLDINLITVVATETIGYVNR